MAQERDPVELMKELREGGQRGFVIGDNHDQLSTPVYLRDNMDRFKEMGINKLYVEFNDDIKPMLGALSDPKAAGELRDHLSATMAPLHPLAGEAQYEMIMAAHEAGLKVVPIDKDNSGAFSPERLEKADKAMAEAVRADDNGKDGYLVVVGAGHTYGANLGLSCIDNKTGEFYGADKTQCKPDDKYLSPQGGIDAQLGIPSIDVLPEAGPTAVFNNKAKSDYTLRLPEHSQQKVTEANTLERVRGENNHYARQFEKAAQRDGLDQPQRDALMDVSGNFRALNDTIKDGVSSKPMHNASKNLEDSLNRVNADEKIPQKVRATADELSGELIMKGMDTQIAMASSDSVKRLDGLSDSFNLAGKKPEAAKDDLAFASSDQIKIPESLLLLKDSSPAEAKKVSLRVEKPSEL